MVGFAKINIELQFVVTITIYMCCEPKYCEKLWSTFFPIAKNIVLIIVQKTTYGMLLQLKS